MRHTTLATIAFGIVVLATGWAFAQHHGHGDHKGHAGTAPDTRIAVTIPPELASHMLANMRDHLLALQQISEALGREQSDVAAKIAEERLGMSSLRTHGAHEVAKYMPQGMQDAGSAMHRAASRLAIEARNAGVTGDLRRAVVGLADVMSACVGCHAGYRLK